MCPGGNYYMDVGNPFCGIIFLVITTVTLALFGLASLGYFYKEKSSKWYLFAGFGFMVFTIIWNVIDFCQHI
jgi:hypothetical protein